MSKSKTRELNLKNVGGRIRKARTDALLSIKELSEKIEVSFAYLGMVERGERNPSDKMLASIADATGVSVEWLQEGDVPKESDTDDAERIDVSLFLNLVLHEAPEITTQILSAILAIDEKKLDALLRETNTYNPAWYTGCSTIAQRLDIPKVLGKLSEIAFFLRKTEIQMVDYKIIDKLCDTLSEVLGSQFEFYKQDMQCTARYPDIWSLANEPGEPTRSFIFQQVSTHERCQTSLYIPLIERYADRLPSIIFDALDIQGSDIDSIALVFSDRASFEKSKSIIAESMPARAPEHSPIKNVVTMLIDPGSLQILDKHLCWHSNVTD